MVAEADDAEHVLERWRAGRASELDLYLVVSEAMDQAARRGLWRILREEPDPDDVHSAVHDAFLQLWAKDPADIDRLVSLAATIANRRGRDRGRAIIGQNKKLRALTDKIGGQLELDEFDDQAAAARAERMTAAKGCLGELTDEQRDVLDYTYAQGGTLSDWAHERGKTHQGAVRQRQRAEATLRRCVAGKQAADASTGNSNSTDRAAPGSGSSGQLGTGLSGRSGRSNGAGPRAPGGKSADGPGTLDSDNHDREGGHE